MIDELKQWEYDRGYKDAITVLDKINAEIQQKHYDFMGDNDYDDGVRFGLMLAYHIVDQHKRESEVQECLRTKEQR